MVFDGGKQSQKIFFKLQANKFLRPHEAHRFRPRRVRLIPGIDNSLSEKVYPSPIRSRETQCGPKGGRCNVDHGFIELSSISQMSAPTISGSQYIDEYITIPVLVLKKQRIGGADDVRLSAVVCQNIKLLKRNIWAEQRSLVYSVSLKSDLRSGPRPFRI